MVFYYIFYLNGLIEQTLRQTFASTKDYEFTNLIIPIAFSNNDTAEVFISAISEGQNGFGSSTYLLSSNTLKGKLYGIWNDDRCTGMNLYARGY